jgi:KamA family protein
MLPDSALEELLAALPSPLRVRIHSRTPVTLPSRFTNKLYNLFDNLTNRLIFVVHANHKNELDADSSAVFACLKKSGATVLSQSVLLRGVNDTPEALAELCEALFAQGVLPYYLHLLDRAAGTAHFEVPENESVEIYRKLRALLPGYLVPRLARELPQGTAKELVV